jgi:hypothetical protein
VLSVNTMADRRPLVHETLDLSDTAESTPALPSLGFTSSSHARGLTHIIPPTSPPTSRSNFSPRQRDATAERNTPSTIHEDDEEEHVADTFRGPRGSGLGIASPESPAHIGTGRRVSIQAIPRRAAVSTSKPSPIKSPGTLSPPGSANPFSDNFARDSSNENTPVLGRERFDTFDNPRRVFNSPRETTSGADDYQQYMHTTDTERLRGAPSIKSAYESDFRPTHECPTTRDFYQSRFTWLNVSIIVICLFSCVFSGIFMGLALREPFWGRSITSNGPLTPANAILLTTIFAKLIELSFVTSFVAFLGQVLSRRAFAKDHGRGVSLSELSMSRWVVQPGTLLTHYETAYYAGFSFLGILSLVSTVLATCYSSAAATLGKMKRCLTRSSCSRLRSTARAEGGIVEEHDDDGSRQD